MFTETIQLETLRQKIEDTEYEAGNQSDFLDRGNPNPAQAKQAQDLITRLNSESKSAREELKQLIATIRSQNPQAIEEWVDFHVGILQKIVEEKASGANAVTRQNVAKGTLKEWKKVRADEQTYVNINWYFLKDYKEGVRKIVVKSTDVRAVKDNNKAWWQFWK